MKHIILLVFLSIIKVSFSANPDSINFVDGHSHIGFDNQNGKIELCGIDYLKIRNIKTVFYNLPVKRTFTGSLYSQIFKEIEQLDSLFNKTDNKAVSSENNPNFYFCIEYFKGLGGYNEDTFKKLSQLGIKYIGLIDHKKFSLFEKGKLTDLGQDLIEKLNNSDITIDITHLNENEMLSVIDYSKKPVITSHACIQGVADLAYNLTDTVIDKIAKKDGLIFISFNRNGLFTKNEDTSNGIKRFCEHVDYLKNRLRIEQIGIGTDLQADGEYVPEELNMKDTKDRIVEEFKKKGYSLVEIELILNKNISDFFKL